MSEKFCLNWEEFSSNLDIKFQQLRSDNDFCDVTIASEDKQQITAHKVVLSMGSAVFRNILISNKHSHPLIYLKGIKAKELHSIIDFIYHGNVTILQEDLARFLAIAQDLEIQGLLHGTVGPKSGQGEEDDIKMVSNISPKKIDLNSKQNMKSKKKNDYADNEIQDHPHRTVRPVSAQVKIEESNKITILSPEKVDMNAKHATDSGTIEDFVDETQGFVHDTNSQLEDLDQSVVSVSNHEDLDNSIRNLLEKIEGGWRCKVCDKTNIKRNNRQNMLSHVENCHINAEHPCNQCGKITKSRDSLRFHTRKHHEQ